MRRRGESSRAGWARLAALAAAAGALTLLAGCGGPIDPNRPPLPKDYQPPPLEDGPQSDPLKRI